MIFGDFHIIYIMKLDIICEQEIVSGSTSVCTHLYPECRRRHYFGDSDRILLTYNVTQQDIRSFLDHLSWKSSNMML